MLNTEIIEKAVATLKMGGIIAYPTEAVYGLGCDPFNEKAVQKLLSIKKRSIEKGLILLGAHFSDFENLVDVLEPEQMDKVWATWPGPVTWAFPATPSVPNWVRGIHKTIAIRVTNHPIAFKICEAFHKPIISSSANREGDIPLREKEAVMQYFGDVIDFVVPGPVGGRANPSEIRDAMTGKTLRRG